MPSTSTPPYLDDPPYIDVEIVSPDAAQPQDLEGQERQDLARARHLLSTPSVAIRFANLVGSPIEKSLQLLPAPTARLVQRITRAALHQALQIALRSLDLTQAAVPDNRWHKIAAGTSGAVGGAFGFGALVFELPFSTTLMLRSIAQIAASQGHDLRRIENRLACLEVFALGGDTRADNAAETSYWAVRAALAKLVTEAASAAVGRAAAAESTPAAVRLLTALAARFGVVVSEQVAAKAVPIVGAAAGAAINITFMDHFQKMAEGHFIVRRLEARYGTDTIRRAFATLPA